MSVCVICSIYLLFRPPLILRIFKPLVVSPHLPEHCPAVGTGTGSVETSIPRAEADFHFNWKDWSLHVIDRLNIIFGLLMSSFNI
jgi:hypothetical protein